MDREKKRFRNGLLYNSALIAFHVVVVVGGNLWSLFGIAAHAFLIMQYIKEYREAKALDERDRILFPEHYKSQS